MMMIQQLALLTLFVGALQAQIAPSKRHGFQPHQKTERCLPDHTQESKRSRGRPNHTQDNNSYSCCYSTYGDGDFIRETPYSYHVNVQSTALDTAEKTTDDNNVNVWIERNSPVHETTEKTARADVNNNEVNYPWPENGQRVQIFCHVTRGYLQMVSNPTDISKPLLDCNGHPDDDNTFFRVYTSFVYEKSSCNITDFCCVNSTDSCCSCQPAKSENVTYNLGMTASKISANYSEPNQYIYMLSDTSSNGSLTTVRTECTKAGPPAPKPKTWGASVNFTYDGHNNLHILKIEEKRVFSDRSGVVKLKAAPKVEAMSPEKWERFGRDPGQEYRLVFHGEKDYSQKSTGCG